MKEIKDLNIELHQLIIDFKNNNDTLEQVLKKFEKLIEEFQKTPISNKENSKIVNEMKDKISIVLIKINQLKNLNNQLIEEQKIKEIYRTELGLSKNNLG
ncbi:conserved hypothetical protein [Tenacibaculum sp. 190524A02b]|uniref:Uncharacterized protein n=1 Tax=Tenacibaculum vairaonense TaxID=3137860 RepID=A0ABM9PPA9_9FLAO